MPFYASFDHTKPSPAQVTGWYNTNKFVYSTMPPTEDLLEISPAQWDERLANPSGWAISSGMLVSYIPQSPPGPTLAQQVAAIPSVPVWKIKIVLSEQPGAEVGKTLLDDANVAVAAASVRAQIAWANAADVQRSSPTLATLATALNLSSSQIDTFYLAASQVLI